MSRIMVYVPDDLYKRAQDRKEQLNFSELFRKALSEKLQMLVRSEVELQDIETSIEEGERGEMLERLRQEKEAYERQGFISGYEGGIWWAKQANYGQLQFYGHQNLSNIDNLPDELRQSVIEEASMSHQINLQAYAEGWFRGVRLFATWVNDQLPVDQA